MSHPCIPITGLNNTTHPRPCNVSCNNTYLVLSYQGSDTAGYWIRGNESGPYVDINGHPLNPFHPICWEQNCTLNKTLTNDDSGPYFFIPYSFLPGPTQQYPRVIVNILGEFMHACIIVVMCYWVYRLCYTMTVSQ